MLFGAYEQSLHPPVPPSQAEITQKQLETIRWKRASEGAILLHDAVKNPASFKVIAIRASSDDYGICYTYRAQNSFGGMNVERAVLNKDERLLTPDTVGFNLLWDSTCDGPAISADAINTKIKILSRYQ